MSGVCACTTWNDDFGGVCLTCRTPIINFQGERTSAPVSPLTARVGIGTALSLEEFYEAKEAGWDYAPQLIHEGDEGA